MIAILLIVGLAAVIAPLHTTEEWQQIFNNIEEQPTKTTRK